MDSNNITYQEMTEFELQVLLPFCFDMDHLQKCIATSSLEQIGILKQNLSALKTINGNGLLYSKCKDAFDEWNSKFYLRLQSSLDVEKVIKAAFQEIEISKVPCPVDEWGHRSFSKQCTGFDMATRGEDISTSELFEKITGENLNLHYPFRYEDWLRDGEHNVSCLFVNAFFQNLSEDYMRFFTGYLDAMKERYLITLKAAISDGHVIQKN